MNLDTRIKVIVLIWCLIFSAWSENTLSEHNEETGSRGGSDCLANEVNRQLTQQHRFLDTQYKELIQYQTQMDDRFAQMNKKLTDFIADVKENLNKQESQNTQNLNEFKLSISKLVDVENESARNNVHLIRAQSQLFSDLLEKSLKTDREIDKGLTHFNSELRKEIQIMEHSERLIFFTMLNATLIENKFYLRPLPFGDGCLKKGTLILMADRTEKPVESIQIGDMVLDHALQPTRVIGVLEKFLLSESFHGFSEDGPYFFTDTHILVGPNHAKDGIQLHVSSLEGLVSENPLMQHLNVRQFNRSGTELLTYDSDRREVVTKLEKIYDDPANYPLDTLVHIIEVESSSGTYFANGFVCRHEIPPMELWPNTINLILSLGNNAEVQRIENSEYTLPNVLKVIELLEIITKKIEDDIQHFHFDGNVGKTEDISGMRNNGVDSNELLTKVFGNSMFSTFLVGLYGKVGPLISNVLDSPDSTKSSDELQAFTSIIINRVLNETKYLFYLL